MQQVHGRLRDFQLTGAWGAAIDGLLTAQQNGLKIAEISMNLLLGAASHRGKWSEAIEIFGWMQQWSIRCSAVSSSTVLRSRRAEWSGSFAALERMISATVPTNVFTFNAALNSLDRSSWQLALHHLRRRLLVADVDATSWNSVISAAAAASQWQQALWLFQCMQRWTPHDVVSYGAALHSCDLGSAWPCALQLQQMLRQQTLRSNLVCCTSTLKSCCHWPRVMSLLREAQRELLIEPNLVTHTATLSAFSAAQRWSAALAVQDVVTADAMHPDTIFVTEILSSCDDSKKWRSASCIFSGLRRMAVLPNFMTFSALMSSTSKAQLWPKALGLRDVSAISAGAGAAAAGRLGNAAINAVAQGGHWSLCGQVLEKMPLEGMTLSCIADTMAQSLEPSWAEALWWFSRHRWVQRVHWKAVEMAGCTVINACEKWQQWRRSLRILEDLDSWRVPVGEMTFNSAIVACEKGQIDAEGC